MDVNFNGNRFGAVVGGFIENLRDYNFESLRDLSIVQAVRNVYSDARNWLSDIFSRAESKLEDIINEANKAREKNRKFYQDDDPRVWQEKRKSGVGVHEIEKAKVEGTLITLVTNKAKLQDDLIQIGIYASEVARVKAELPNLESDDPDVRGAAARRLLDLVNRAKKPPVEGLDGENNTTYSLGVANSASSHSDVLRTGKVIQFRPSTELSKVDLSSTYFGRESRAWKTPDPALAKAA